MTSEQFNKKYESFKEQGHYGLSIDIPSVVDYLNWQFKDLIMIPDFKYSQIKLKFNTAIFYCKPDSIDSNKIENEINRLVKEHNTKK